MIHYTTIGQSKKLIELGLDPLTSDMCYSFTGEHIEDAKDEDFSVSVGLASAIRYNLFSYRYGYDIPCWSLGALIELMPKVISVPVDERSAYFYDLEWQFANDNSLRYIATNRDKCLIDIYSDHDIRGKSFIETAFEMVCWLFENGYIKKGE